MFFCSRTDHSHSIWNADSQFKPIQLWICYNGITYSPPHVRLIQIYCNASISRLSWVLVGHIEPKVQQNVNDSLYDSESCDIILRFNVLHVELKWKRSVCVHLCIYSSSSLCAIVCERVRRSVCTHTGELEDSLMEGHYILVSSASVLRVWNAAALAPRTPVESHPKDPPTPLYIRPSLPPSSPLSPSAWPLPPPECLLLHLSLSGLSPQHSPEEL